MGVRGLTTYVTKNPKLSECKLEWSTKDKLSTPRRLVIDGTAFAHHAYTKSSLDWILGGQYRDFACYIRAYVRSLQLAHFELAFLFDGRLPSSKLQTRLKRETDKILNIEELNLQPSTELNDCRRLFVIPLLALDICLQTLNSIDGIRVEVCETEADGQVALLAQNWKAYAVSNDSDFFIYELGGQGYIPLDTFEVPVKLNDSRPSSKSVTIRATVYQRSVLAEHLQIHEDQFPLFASLIGNDYIENMRIPLSSAKAYKPPSVRIQEAADYLKTSKDTQYLVDSIMKDLSDIDSKALLNSLEQYTPIYSKYSTKDVSLKFLDVLGPSRCFWGTSLVEDIEEESSWLASRRIREHIYQLLVPDSNERVTEYIRCSKKVIQEQIILKNPIHSKVVLDILNFNTFSIRSLPNSLLPLAVTLRTLLVDLPSPITKHDISALAAMGILLMHTRTSETNLIVTQPTRKTLHVAALYQTTLYTTFMLWRVCLIERDFPPLEQLYDGILLHCLLGQQEEFVTFLPEGAISDYQTIIKAIFDEVPDLDRFTPVKNKSKKKDKSTNIIKGSTLAFGSANRNIFESLNW